MSFDDTDTMLVDYGEVWRYIGIQPFDVVLQKKKLSVVC